MHENPELENLIAKTFISRTDVVAVQNTSKTYMPVHRKWTREMIRAHLNKQATYGHYLVDKETNNVKLFALDLDIRTGLGYLPTIALPPDPTEAQDQEWVRSFQEIDMRAAWADRSSPARPFMKYQMKFIAHRLMSRIYSDLGVRCTAAYSGSKGLHIYGLTGVISAAEARDAADIVLDMCGWRLYKGASKYASTETDPVTGFPQYDIEVYPKQSSMEEKELGNLLRLPLGMNKKAPKDPTFFLDMRTALGDWTPVDAVWALTTDNPWSD